MNKATVVLLAVAGLAVAQPPDVRGFDEFKLGMPLAKAAALYPNTFQEIKHRRYPANKLLERLRAKKFPFGEIAMQLSIYTRGNTDGIAMIVLSPAGRDRAVSIWRYVAMLLTRSLGRPARRRMIGQVSNVHGSIDWRFPTTDVRFKMAGDDYLRVVILPHGEKWPDEVPAPMPWAGGRRPPLRIPHLP
jgi:hypothetical protein